MAYKPTEQELAADRKLRERFALGAEQNARLEEITERQRAAWSRLHQELIGRGGLVLSDLTLSAIQAEATRAHIRRGSKSMLGPAYSTADRLMILLEEFGEAAEMRWMIMAAALGRAGHALTYDQPGGEDRRERLVKELIQVAATAGSLVELAEKGLV